MDDELIQKFLVQIERSLKPQGHLMFWVDKFILCNDLHKFKFNELKLVDMIVWNKMKMGMGYRSRRTAEYLLIYQKEPTRAKDVWTVHNIPDVWSEKVDNKIHPHIKPLKLQERLIEAVTDINDIVIDPCAGSFSVMQAALNTNRGFYGCNIKE